MAYYGTQTSTFGPLIQVIIETRLTYQKTNLEVFMPPTLSVIQAPSDGPNESKHDEVPLRPVVLLLLQL